MIPQANVQACRARVPWPNPWQVALLPAGVRFDHVVAIDAFNLVWRQLVSRLRGSAWRLSDEVIDQLRRTRAGLLP